MKSALCVTAGIEQVVSIRKAQELGLRVIAVDKDPHAPGLRLADEGHALDPSAENEVVNLARRTGIELVLPVPMGHLLTTVGAVNDRLGLRGVSRQAAAYCTDKLAFRQRLNHFGMKQVEYASARGREQLLDVLKSFPLPCVLKPRFGSGSRGVVVIHERVHIEKLVDEHLLSMRTSQDTIVEEYVKGQEVGVDAAIHSGKFVITAIRMKTLTPFPHRQTVGYHGPVRLPETVLEQLNDVLSTAVKAIGCEDSLLNFDVILSNDGMPFLIEMAARPAGLLMAERMVPAMTGIDFISEGIKMLLGLPVNFKPRREIPVALRFLQFPPGVVTKVADHASVPQSDGVLDFSCNLKPGDRLRRITSGSDVLSRGFVMATGSNIAEALSRTESVANTLYKTTVMS